MENLDQGVKRDLPSGEDAIAAAMYAEEIEADGLREGKRARLRAHGRSGGRCPKRPKARKVTEGSLNIS